MSTLAATRRATWWPAALALVLATVSLGVSLQVPMLFSDPNGVDPYMVRLSLTSLVVVAAVCVAPRAAPARGVVIAITSATVSFTVLSALPQLIVDVAGGTAPNGDWLIFWASVAYVVVTFAVAALALRFLPPPLRPSLRLLRFGPLAVVAAVAGSVVLLLVVLALPATWLGRLALQPVAIARDLPLLGPANALQGFAQEVQFRGLLMGSLERHMPRGWANLAQACFFGLAHLAVNYEGPVGPFVPVTIAVGFILGWLVQRTHSLWPAILIHAVADIAIVVGVLPGLYGY